MRNNGFDKLAFLVVLGVAAMVALAAAGTGPAYSDDTRTDPAKLSRSSVAEASPAELAPAEAQPEPAPARSAEVVAAGDSEGYEWSGSRPAGQRYLWSHRPN